MKSLEDRIVRLEAESHIRQLIARYCFFVDDRDIPRIRTLFASDATLRSADGVINATGIDAIMQQFDGRFDALGPGWHFMHDTQIDFVGDGSNEAEGRVSGHAELWRGEKMMVCGIRYKDRYRNTSEGWKFAVREINFLYYVPIADYPNILAVTDRNRAYSEPRPADFPESLASWKAYEKSRGRG